MKELPDSGNPPVKYCIPRQGPTPTELRQFRKCLRNAETEHQVTAFLQKHPAFFVQVVAGGHVPFVIPSVRLGAEYVPDFLVGFMDSGGYHYVAVELESPRARMFTKAGDPSKVLNHAIRQITDWRAWLQRNRDYAVRHRREEGLGLLDITPRLAGLIVLGRESDLDPSTIARRQQMSEDLHILIHTYDWLLRTAEDPDHAKADK